MEVKIGVQHAPREIVLESGQTAEEVERAVADALAGKSALLSLTDDHGRKVLVPADRLAYVEHRRADHPQGGLQRAVSTRQQWTEGPGGISPPGPSVVAPMGPRPEPHRGPHLAAQMMIAFRTARG